MPAVPLSALSQEVTFLLQEGKIINLTARIEHNHIITYTVIFNRLEPSQLERAREVYREELVLAPQPREDLTLRREQLWPSGN